MRFKPQLGASQVKPLLQALASEVEGMSQRPAARRQEGLAQRRRSTIARSAGLVQSMATRQNAHRGVRLLWLVGGVQVRCTPELAEELRARPDVEKVELDPFLSVALPRPTAPRVSTSAGAWQLNMIRATGVREELGLTGKGVTVGLLDTGIVDAGPLAGRIAAYRDFTSRPAPTPTDPLGHGTAVASVLAGARTSEGCGVAPGCKLVVARVLEELELTGTAVANRKVVGAFAGQIVQAMQWMLDPDGDPSTDDAPRIVNNSWGFSNPELLSADYFRPAVDAWTQAGILPVFSAGNTVDEATKHTFFPASYEQVLAVGSVGLDRSWSPFSAVGRSAEGRAKPDMVAPGASVLAWNASGYASFDGTSFAAPQVAAVAALLLEAWPELTRQELFELLTSTAVDLGEPGPDRLHGAGLLQAESASAALMVKAEAKLVSSPSLEAFLASLEALLGRVGEQPFAERLAARAAERFAAALPPKEREQLASLPRAAFPAAKPYLLAQLSRPSVPTARAAAR